jgi:periplasmic copper chaperone A
MLVIRTAALAAFVAISSSSIAKAESGIEPSCAYGQAFTAGAITITGAFIPATPKGAPTAAAYLRIANSGAADVLLGAASAAGSATIHQMTQNGSVMQMAPVEDGLAIPAGGAVSLDPMGYHLMLTGMPQPFVAGQCVAMVLHFAKTGDLPITLNIGGIGTTTAPTDSKPGVSVIPSGSTDMSSMAMGM